jgi:hypothetical protein
MFINTKELIKKMPYTCVSSSILYSISSFILYVCKIQVAENMEIEIVYKDKYFNYADEVYKITVSPNGITRELIGNEIYWTSYNNKNHSDTFLVLKDGVVVKEESEIEEEKEDVREEETDYQSDSTEIVYSSDEEDKPRYKRTTAFLVFASENKKDKTDLNIINVGPSSVPHLNWLTEMGELWRDLSIEDHANYAKKAQLINSQYDEFLD